MPRTLPELLLPYPAVQGAASKRLPSIAAQCSQPEGYSIDYQSGGNRTFACTQVYEQARMAPSCQVELGRSEGVMEAGALRLFVCEQFISDCLDMMNTQS